MYRSFQEGAGVGVGGRLIGVTVGGKVMGVAVDWGVGVGCGVEVGWGVGGGGKVMDVAVGCGDEVGCGVGSEPGVVVGWAVEVGWGVTVGAPSSRASRALSSLISSFISLTSVNTRYPNVPTPAPMPSARTTSATLIRTAVEGNLNLAKFGSFGDRLKLYHRLKVCLAPVPFASPILVSQSKTNQ